MYVLTLEVQNRFQPVSHPRNGDLMVRKGFWQRVIRYFIFLTTFLLLFALWAALFGKYDIILKTLVSLPLSLSAVVVLDLIGLGHWMRKQKIARAIPTLILVTAIIVIIANGEPGMSVPLIVMLVWIIGYTLRQQLSMHDGEVTPPG